MPHGRRPPLALIYAVTITGILGNSLLAPGLPDLLDDFGVGDGAAGPIFAVTSLPGVVMAPVIGILADRLGRRAVLVPCLAIFGLSGLAAAIAPNYGLFLLARFGMGIGAAGLVNLAVVLIGDHWEGAERTRLIGRNAAVLTVGLAVSPLVAGVITEWFGWRWAVSPYALGLVMAVVAWRTLDPHRPTSGTLRDQLAGLGPVLRSPVVLAVLFSGTLVFILVFGAFLTTMPLHLERELALSAGARGVMLSVPAVAASLVAFNLGRLRARVPLRALLTGSAVVMIVAFVLLGLSPVLASVIVGSSLYGLGEGLLIPALQDVAVQNAPSQHRGAVVAAWVGAARLGQTTGPLAAGALLTATSTSTTLLASAVLAGVMLVVLSLAPFHERHHDEVTAVPG